MRVTLDFLLSGFPHKALVFKSHDREPRTNAHRYIIKEKVKQVMANSPNVGNKHFNQNQEMEGNSLMCWNNYLLKPNLKLPGPSENSQARWLWGWVEVTSLLWVLPHSLPAASLAEGQEGREAMSSKGSGIGPQPCATTGFLWNLLLQTPGSHVSRAEQSQRKARKAHFTVGLYPHFLLQICSVSCEV